MSSETLEEGRVLSEPRTKNKIPEEMDSVSVTNFSSKCEADDTSIRHPNAGLSDLSMKESTVYDGINLFVEVFGPLDGTSEGNSNTPSKQEHSFEVGDLVWAKTEALLWWPGMIHDPSDGHEKKPVKKGRFFVKFYDEKADFVWSNSSELKPFIEYYKHFSSQSVSRSFYDAVEKALSDIGRRVKLSMSCPCVSKGKDENLGKTEDVLSLSRFEPSVFLTSVKEFAGGIYPPSKIELTVVKSRLASFYCSTGHLGLPLQVLLEAKYKGCNNNNKDNNNNVSGGCLRSVRTIKKRTPVDYDDLCSGSKTVSGSRERKKSKFLSYPFTSSEEETGKSSKKKRAAKSLKDNHIISKEDDVRAPSSKLLTNLHSMARGYFYGRKYSDSLRTFYGSFRSYAYLDPDTADVEINRKQERIKKARESKNHPSSNLESVGEKISMKREDQNQSHVSIGTNVSRDSSCLNTDNNLVPPVNIELSENEGLVCPNVPSSEDALPQISNVAIVNDGKLPKSDEDCFQFTDSAFIPDLNTAEMMNLDMRSPSEKSTLSEEHESKKRAAEREEDPGGSITLNFAPGFELPSKEKLFTEFSRYGLVKKSEIKAVNECVIQIPYERTPDVKFAHRSLERGHSFGEFLLSFDLHCKEEKKPEKKRQMKDIVVNVSVNEFKNRARPVEKPDVAFMKRKVEGMRSTLAKLGDRVSPETRVMLEKEIQAFLDKIGGSSSSA